ncbi:MAG TPA: hypothetical protein VGA84_16955 [Thermoanaerobaculia bacterium]
MNLVVELMDFALELSPSLFNLAVELMDLALELSPSLFNLVIELSPSLANLTFELLEALTSLYSRLIDPACQVLQAVFDQGTEISFLHGPILPRRYDRGEASRVVDEQVPLEGSIGGPIFSTG